MTERERLERYFGSPASCLFGCAIMMAVAVGVGLSLGDWFTSAIVGILSFLSGALYATSCIVAGISDVEGDEE